MGLFKKRKVILALGGGSARGLSNIGVLKALERHFGRGNMPFDMIVGTSIGSLIGAACCLGVPIERQEKIAYNFKWPDLVDLGIYSTGLVKGDKLEQIIHEIVDNKTFENLTKPFALTTTDIQTGEELVHTSGDLVKLIRASCSWPGIFSAVKYGGRLLVDGGVRNSIPTKTAYDFGASFVIAVNPGFAVKNQKVNNVIQAMVQAVQIMGEELNTYQTHFADVAIKPDLGELDQFEFDKAREIVRQGEIAAEKKMPELKRKLFFHSLGVNIGKQPCERCA